MKVDPYGAAALCTLPAVTPDPMVSKLGQTGTDMTFYVTSDLHFFRRNFNLTDQLTHVKVLNQFASTGAVWPSGAGIPANTLVEKPLAVVIDGDFTTHGLPQDLGAFRINYERGTLPSSLKYPILVGLGNHETISDETPENAKRMFDYVQTRMANTHIDTQSGNYSWDWQGVHMVQLGTWAGDQTSLYAHSSEGLAWLANDLKTYVGHTTRPVMLFEHYPLLDISTDAKAVDSTRLQTGKGYETFWNIVNKYNVVAMFSGHIHCVGMYSSMASRLPVQQPLYPGVIGYGRPLDNFLDGSGGDTGNGAHNVAGVGNGCSATIINGKSVSQTAVASFLVTHVNAHYVDIAAVSWTRDGSHPYFDKAEGLPTGAAACRKRINNQFIAASGLANVVATPTGYNVTAPRGTPEGVPLALKFGSRSRVDRFSFVDSCSDEGDSGTNSLYFPVNGESDLAAGKTYAVVAARPGSADVMPVVVILTPMSGATPTAFRHVSGVDSLKGDQVTVYGPPGGAFRIEIDYSGTASGWLKTNTITDAFDTYGMAVIKLQYTKPTGGYGVSTATVTATTTATGVVQSVSVAVSDSRPSR